MKTLTIEQTPKKISDTILLDDWVAYIPFKEAKHLYLVLRKLRKEYVVHVYNTSLGGYCYGDYFRSYEDAFKQLKKRAKNSSYELGQLVQIEGNYGDE